jgi:hypothetical protein
VFQFAVLVFARRHGASLQSLGWSGLILPACVAVLFTVGIDRQLQFRRAFQLLVIGKMEKQILETIETEASRGIDEPPTVAGLR